LAGNPARPAVHELGRALVLERGGESRGVVSGDDRIDESAEGPAGVGLDASARPAREVEGDRRVGDLEGTVFPAMSSRPAGSGPVPSAGCC